nr:exocyst complex component EXO70A1-like [Ipomoea batatas]
MGGGFFSSSSKPGSPLSFPSKSPSPSPPRSSFSETLMKETISTVEPMIRKWDLEESATYERISYLFRDNRVEAMEFLSCVNDLQHSMQLVAMENSSSEHLVTAHNLMQIAMKRLQKEFYTILSGNRYFLDPSTRFSGTSSAKSSVSDLGDDNVSEEDEETVGRAGRVPDAAVSEIVADWPLSTNSPLPEAYFSTPHPDDDDSGASAVSERRGQSFKRRFIAVTVNIAVTWPLTLLSKATDQ